MIVIVALSAFTSDNEYKIDINSAVKTGMVQVKINGKGGHSGACVSVHVENLKNKNIRIFFPPGQRLNSVVDAEQDLLIVKEQEVILASKEKKNADIRAFCCQSSNLSPANQSKFTLGKKADENLVKLAEYINKRIIPEPVIQEAVWSVSNNNPVSNVSLDYTNPILAKMKNNVDELRKFVCTLTKQEDVWYSTPQNRVVNQRRQIVSNPVEVFGSIKYKVKEKSKIHSELINPQGQIVFQRDGDIELSPGNWDYDFNLKVIGFPPGEYTVKLIAKGELLMEKKFVI